MMDKVRCSWCGSSDLYRKYHDEEWGVPSFDDQHLFEMLILEGNQAGLSWITILNKRENFREAFDGFDAEKMACYDQAKIDSLLQNKGIIRNKLKINAAINNARRYLEILDKGNSFSDYLWQFTDGKVITNKFRNWEEIPANTPESNAMSKKLKQDGFKFVGSTIMYAHMQATGMVNDHIVDCFRYEACKELVP